MNQRNEYNANGSGDETNREAKKRKLSESKSSDEDSSISETFSEKQKRRWEAVRIARKKYLNENNSSRSKTRSNSIRRNSHTEPNNAGSDNKYTEPFGRNSNRNNYSNSFGRSSNRNNFNNSYGRNSNGG